MDCDGWSAGVASMVREVSGFIQKVREMGPDILTDHFDLHSTDNVVKSFHLGLKKRWTLL